MIETSEENNECPTCARIPTEEEYTLVTDRRGNDYVCCDEECASIFKQEFSDIF